MYWFETRWYRLGKRCARSCSAAANRLSDRVWCSRFARCVGIAAFFVRASFAIVRAAAEGKSPRDADL